MNLGRPVGGVARWLMRPIGWATYLAVGSALAWLLWQAATDPGLRYTGLFVFATAFFCIPVGLYHLLSLTIRIATAAAYAQPTYRLASEGRRWRRLWAAVGVAVVLVWFNVPLYVAFWVSRPWLDRVGREVAAAGPAADAAGTSALASERRAGLFVVSPTRTRSVDGRVVMLFFRDPEDGFAYCPGRESELSYNAGTHGHLAGPWYWFTED